MASQPYIQHIQRDIRIKSEAKRPKGEAACPPCSMSLCTASFALVHFNLLDIMYKISGREPYSGHLTSVHVTKYFLKIT